MTSKKSGSKTNNKQKISSDEEIWKPFPYKLFKNKYLVSNKGRILNNTTNNITKGTVKMGYYYFKIMDNYVHKSFRVHRLVAKLFVKNSDKNKNIIVNHIDGNKLNNNYKNLEWTTITGNNKHCAAMGLVTKTKRRIAQYDLEGNLIKEYDSIIQAHNETGISTGAISDVCNQKR